MISRAAPLPSLDPVVVAMRQAGLGVEHGSLDPSPYNEAGSGFFVYGPPGGAQRVLVMVSTLCPCLDGWFVINLLMEL